MNMQMEAKAAVQTLTVDVGQVLRNVAGVETDREKKSFFQRILEPEEIDDGTKDEKKAQKIARKIARGETVTQQEKAFLMKTDPRLAQMAELARQQGERLRHTLQQASSGEEQQNAIHQAYQMVIQTSKSNPQFGELLGEAVKAAVEDSRKKGFLQDKDSRGQAAGMEEGTERAFPDEQPGLKEQEALLEQFFPEDVASIMDCRG